MNAATAVAVTTGVFLISGSAALAIGALIGLAVIAGGSSRMPERGTWDIWLVSEAYDTPDPTQAIIENAYLVATLHRGNPLVSRSLQMQGVDNTASPDVVERDFAAALHYAIQRRAKPIYTWNDLTKTWARVF